jgi:hypothetical protein
LAVVVATAPFVAPRRREPTRKGIALGIIFLLAAIAVQIGVVGSVAGWTSPTTYYIPMLFVASILGALACVKWVF